MQDLSSTVSRRDRRHHPKIFWLALWVSVTMLGSCKLKDRGVNLAPGYILGPSNDISIFEKGDPRLTLYDFSASSVLVTTILADSKVKFCSGTLVPPAPNEQLLRVLTNHHCFAESDQDAKARSTLLKEACVKTRIYLEFYKGSTKKSLSFECARGSLRTNFDMDLAVFTVKEPLPPKYRPLSIFQGTIAELKGRPAMIVHYPDIARERDFPGEGGPPLPVAAYTHNDCRIGGAFAAEEAKLDRTLPFGIKHSCDLIHGSSGSALLDPQSGTVLGVNWGGIQINAGGGLDVNNVATAAPFVRAFLDHKTGDNLLTKDATGGLGAASVPASGVTPQGQNPGTSERSGKDASAKKSSCGVVRVDQDSGSAKISLERGTLHARASRGTQGASSMILLVMGLISPFVGRLTWRCVARSSRR